MQLTMKTITENFNTILDRQKSIGYDYYSVLNLPPNETYQTIAECYENSVFLLEDVTNSHTGFRPLIQDDEKWGMTGKKNNPGQDIWDDYINSK